MENPEALSHFHALITCSNHPSEDSKVGNLVKLIIALAQKHCCRSMHEGKEIKIQQQINAFMCSLKSHCNKKKKLARKTFFVNFYSVQLSMFFSPRQQRCSDFNAENFHLNYYFLAEFTMRFLWCSQHNSAFYCISRLPSDSVCGWNTGECLICIINLLQNFYALRLVFGVLVRASSFAFLSFSFVQLSKAGELQIVFQEVTSLTKIAWLWREFSFSSLPSVRLRMFSSHSSSSTPR